ncbi:MAG: CdaR family protein [Desulfovibrionaceae bacterium]
MPSSAGRGMSRTITLLASLLMASLMWYMVCVNDIIDVQMELRLDYYGLPPNLIITDGLVNRVVIRVRGPQTLLRSVTQEYLSRSIDLSQLKPGRNVVPLVKDSLRRSSRAFELVDAHPRQMAVLAEPVLERVVPVVAETYSPLRRGAIEVKECKVTPSVVTLRGPESIVSGLTEVTLPVRVDTQSAGRAEYRDVTLPLPQLVTATPSEVSVEYVVTSGRVTTSRDCPVRLEAVDKEDYTLEPAKLAVLVEVPESLLKSSSYMRKLDVYILPPPLKPGQSVDAVVRYRVPEGMVIQSPPVRTVRVSRRTLPEPAPAPERQSHAAPAAERKSSTPEPAPQGHN